MANRIRDLIVILILFSFTMLFFLLKVSKNWTSITLLNQSQTAIFEIIYCIIALTSLVILIISKAGVTYYQDLKPLHLPVIIGMAVGMYVLALVCSAAFQAQELPLDTIQLESSVFNNILASVLFTVTAVALSEELSKFSAYTFFKSFYKDKNQIKRWALAFTPMILWVLAHGIQSYQNLWYLIPAFANGFLLLVVLEVTHVFYAPVLTHGIYNAIIIVVGYLKPIENGAAMPFFPQTITYDDLYLYLLWLLWTLLVFVPVLLRHRGNKAKAFR